MHTWFIVLKVISKIFSEEDEDDVSFSHSLHLISPPPAIRPPRGDSGRVGVPVLPVNEVPPPPPRHGSQTSLGGGGVARGPLPPLPPVQLAPTLSSTPSSHQLPRPGSHQLPRPPPVRSRPQSTSGMVYGRSDSGQLTQFGPGKQEREVRMLYRCLIFDV